MASRPSLSTLLSQVLVAYTIEFDNEAERLMAQGRYHPWLVSMAMWSNCMRYVPDEGVRAGDLPGLARVSANTMRVCLAGMRRWGYLVVHPDPADAHPSPPGRDWVVHLSPAGLMARGIWLPLFGIIDERWRQRFGIDAVDGLSASLRGVVDRLDIELPEYLPVLGNGLTARVPERTVPAGEAAATAPLPALISKALLAFAIDYESESELSLAISADVVRVIDDHGTRIRDLPRRSGVSKEAIAIAVGYLERHGYARVIPDVTAARTRKVELTSKGRRTRDTHGRLFAEIERRWHERFGTTAVRTLEDSLDALLGRTGANGKLMAEGLVPPPACWRARRPYLTQTNAFIADPRGTLPHYPMVLHRGGYPDGS